MSNESAGDASADVIGTADRDVRRGPVNHLFAASEVWATTTLGEIADIRNGATPSTRISANWDGSIPWCTPTDITNSPGKYLTETARSITEKGLSGCGASLLPAGALLLCSRATIGEIKIASSPICTNQGFKSLVCTEQVHSEFLYYLILTLKPRLVQKAIGSTFLEIGKHALASMEVRLPPLKEQRAIAGALSDVDRLIESLESLIAKKRAVKTAAMQQLLTGMARLPGFSRKWETKRLGEVVSIRKGKPITESSIKPGTVPVVAGGKEPAYLHNCANRIGKTITVSTSGAYAGYVTYWNEPIFASDCSTISDEQSYSVEFIFHQMILRQKDIYRTQTGGVQPHVHTKDLAPLALRIPSLKEQRAIAAVLSDMDTEIALLEQRRDKIRALKNGMIQQLLTGKTRLDESVLTTTRRTSAAFTGKGHNWQINEAVVISVLAGRFGNEEYPLSRKRYTKLSYLLHRHVEGHAEGYLKKAAGPYNPRTRYGGPEKIALKNHYVRNVRRHGSGGYRGFIAGENIERAQGYFSKWYGEDSLKWLDRFRYERSDDLELLTTVDLAAEELRKAGKDISVESVKEAIRCDPEWKAKLNRPIFSDANISRAIDKCRALFDLGHERPKP